LGLLDKVNARRLCVLCHHNADPDALYSGYALSTLLKKVRPRLSIELAAAQGISRLSKHLVAKHPVPLTSSPSIEDADAILLVDTNTTQQLGGWKPLVERGGKPVVFIDHHASHPETEALASIYVIDEKASSACEIVYDLFKESHVGLSREVAFALFLGIAYDTRHFMLGTSRTFKAVADLVEAGVDAEEALSMLHIPMDISERFARLKAAQRTRVVKLNGYLIALSRLSTYQASAARSLIDMGADVAVVGGEKDGLLRVSLRASHDFGKKTGVHIGREIAKPLGEYAHGMGGGHAASAGINGEGDVESVFAKCVELLKERL